ELYTKAVEQLGSDKAPVRLGGLYALERLAQDNSAHRQTIVNVICAYLRMPFSPMEPTSGPVPGQDAGEPHPSAERATGVPLKSECPRFEGNPASKIISNQSVHGLRGTPRSTAVRLGVVGSWPTVRAAPWTGMASGLRGAGHLRRRPSSTDVPDNVPESHTA